MSSLCEFVAGSAARAGVTRELRDGSAPTPSLLEAVPASESSVYAALSDLEDRGLVESVGEGWRLTGQGIVVADILDVQAGVDTVLSAVGDYWRSHDPRALPGWARRELWALEGCEVKRAPATDPSRVIREVADHLDAAAELDVIAPVYHEQFVDAVQTRDGRTRLLLSERVAKEHASEGGQDDLDGVDLRIGRAGFALAVSTTHTFLSLPNRDGGYDAETELVADTEAAVEWGRRVFERRWAAADPVPLP